MVVILSCAVCPRCQADALDRWRRRCLKVHGVRGVSGLSVLRVVEWACLKGGDDACHHPKPHGRLGVGQPTCHQVPQATTLPGHRFIPPHFQPIRVLAYLSTGAQLKGRVKNSPITPLHSTGQNSCRPVSSRFQFTVHLLLPPHLPPLHPPCRTVSQEQFPGGHPIMGQEELEGVAAGGPSLQVGTHRLQEGEWLVTTSDLYYRYSAYLHSLQLKRMKEHILQLSQLSHDPHNTAVLIYMWFNH